MDEQVLAKNTFEVLLEPEEVVVQLPATKAWRVQLDGLPLPNKPGMLIVAEEFRSDLDEFTFGAYVMQPNNRSLSRMWHPWRWS